MTTRTYPCSCEAGPEPVPDYCPVHGIPASECAECIAFNRCQECCAEIPDSQTWCGHCSNFDEMGPED